MHGQTSLPGSIISMTGEAANRLLRGDCGDSALLYLQLLCYNSPAGLNWPPERLSAAYDKLISLGLAQAPAVPIAAPEPAEELPEYTTDDIAREMETSSCFSGLVGEMQRRLGKVLSTADLKTLYTLYDHLALPVEVILLLTIRCIEDFEQKYGPGHKPRMPQIRKEAFRWQREGVDTVEAAERYLARLSALSAHEREILPLLGVTGRPPVERERSYIAGWVENGFSNDAIRLAYEKTVMKKQSMDWSYMNGILRRWHEKGLHTAAQVSASDSGYARRPAPGAPAGLDRPASGEQAKSDMEWMRRMLTQMKQEEGGA